MTDEFDINQETTAIETPLEELSSQDAPLPEETPPKDTRKVSKQTIILIIVGAALLLGLLGMILGLILFSGRSNEDDLVLPNVYAGGIELSGMTMEEAINALHLATDRTFSDEDMVVRIYDDTLQLSPKDTHAALDVTAVAQAAYNYGRSGTHAENQQIRKNAHNRSYTVPLLPYLNLDLALIENTISSYCNAINSDYTDPTVSLEGQRPEYDPNKSPKHQTLSITLGTPLRQLDANDIYEQVLDAYSMNKLLLEYDAPEILWPDDVNAQELFIQYCTPAQDAVLDTTTYSIIPEAYGYGFDIDAAQKKLDDARYGDTVEITFSFLEPKVLSQDLTANLFQETLVEYSAVSNLEDSNRDGNLRLTAKAINGYVIKPGESFSFLQALGTVSVETGYTEAPICAINGSALGGGISQTASALYFCALHADLQIEEHHSHKYAVDFIELGLDAYVDGLTQDLRFKNNTGSPIRINAAVSNHTITISLDGSAKLSYTVAIRTEIKNTQPPQVTYQMLLPNNQHGYKDGDVMVKGVEGYQVAVSKEKIDSATGKQLSLDLVFSGEYKKRDEVIARIGSFVEETPQDPTENTIMP